MLLRLVSVEPEDENSGPIPLAVELAAAWRCEKELAEIADGLDKQPLHKFTGPVSEADAAEHERHKSLRRSLDWSFDLLGDVPGKGARLQHQPVKTPQKCRQRLTRPSRRQDQR